MAYTGRGNTGNRDSHGWAIAGAFAGQVAIIVGIGALLAGAGPTPAVTQASAVPAPAISAVPDIQPLTNFSYQVTMDGQSGSAVFPDSSSVPSFTVKPGQGLTIRLDVTVPPGQSVTEMSVSLIGAPSDGGAPGIQAPYNDWAQEWDPGTHVFILTWPVSASKLAPGTLWTLFTSTGTPGQGIGGPIARITVAS